MALTNQFSLSLELTNLVPFGSLLTSAGRGMLNLMREIQQSGSDIVTEADLAEIFGRNRIEARFASSFRTAVRKSVIHKISDVAELVIEAGGPTVRRGLVEPAYFSTILQLSLLIYTHDLAQLSRCLAKAIEKRAEGATEPVGVPRHDALKGTLRACREQTSGFMWELFLLPVEKKLAHFTGPEGPWITRQIPVPILRALLDSFTAVQYLPESRYIHIETYSGLVPIVVWAHHVLGLTVRVDGNVDGEVSEVRFGSGFESVYIHTCHARPKASLLNETQDLLFQVSVSDEDLRLDSACRQTVLGYGIRCLELGQFKDDMIKGLAHAVVTSCISLVKSEASRRATIGAEYREKDFCPSVQRVLAVGRILFPNYDSMFDDLDLDSEQPCLALSEWTRETLPENLAHEAFTHTSRLVFCRQLGHLHDAPTRLIWCRQGALSPLPPAKCH